MWPNGRMRPRYLIFSALLAATCTPGEDLEPGATDADSATASAASEPMTAAAATTTTTTAPTTSSTTTGAATDDTTASSTGAGSFACGAAQCAAGELCFAYSSDVCNDDDAGDCRPLPEGCTTDDLCTPECAPLCPHYTCPRVSFGCVQGYACGSGCAEQADCLLPGTACKAVSTDGDLSWDHSDCVPAPPRPAAPGEPCTTQGDGDWIWDTCEPGAVCISIDPQTQQGVCVSQCMLADTPACEPCIFYGGGFDDEHVYFCPPTCDPLAPACGADEVCVATSPDGVFACVLDASGAGGAAFEGCEYTNACDLGLACIGFENSAMCDPAFPGCCLPLCDLSAPMCPADTTCQPWYPPGEAPDGLADVGYCGVAP